MAQSFYHFTQKFRGESDSQSKLISEFAEMVYLDSDFPKSSHDFHEISNYIELNSNYSAYVAAFDEIWHIYAE